MKCHELVSSLCVLDSSVDFEGFHNLITKSGCNIFQSLFLRFAAKRLVS